MNRNVMGKILLSNIAEELAAKSNLSREAASSFMHLFFETIEKGLQQDGIVKIKGFGTFKVLDMSDRSSVDVNTGDRITIKGHRKVTFTPDSAMKELVNRPFAHFEPTELNEGYPDEDEPLASEVDNTGDANDEPETEAEELVVVEDVATEEAASVEAVIEEVASEEAQSVDAMPTSEEVAPVDVVTEETVSEEAASVATMAEETISEDVVPVDSVVEEVAEPVEEVIAPVATEAESVQDEVEKTSEGEEVVEDNASPMPTEEVVESVSPAVAIEDTPKVPQQEAKKNRRGCLKWVLILLLLAAALAFVLYWFVIPMPTSESSRKDVVMEQDEIKVKPNLEEELGAEWGNAQKTEEPLLENEVSEPVDSVEEKVEATVEVKVEEQAVAEPVSDPIAPEYTFYITESLQAKTIKDITIADTTDYIMEGTLAVHKLKSGETIIQLSNKYYGDKRLWPYIVKYSKMKDYNNVAIGQRIEIPVLRNK